MSTLREQILALREQPAFRTFQIPGIDAPLGVRLLTLGERVDFLGRQSRDSNPGLFAADLLSMTAVDAEGNRLFGPDDVPALAQIVGPAFDQVLHHAVKVNGLNPEAVEDAAKN